MPFDPPQYDPLGQLGPILGIALRAQQQRHEDEQRRAAEEERSFSQLIELAQHGDKKVVESAGAAFNVPSAKVRFAVDIASQIKSRQDAAQETKAAFGQIPSLSLIGAEQGSAVNPALGSVLDTIARNNPELVGSATQAFSTGVQGLQSEEKRGVRIRGREAEAAQRGSLSAQIALEPTLIARTTAAERTAKAPDELANALVDTEARAAIGFLSPTERDQGVKAIEAQAGPKMYAQIRTRADSLLQARIAELRQTRVSANLGTQGTELDAEAEKGAVAQQFGQDVADQQPPWVYRMMAQGKIVADPFSASVDHTFTPVRIGKNEEARFRQTRIAQMELVQSLDNAKAAFGALRDAAKKGRAPGVGPGIPTSFQDALVFFGAGAPEAALYRNSIFEFVSKLLKSRQGSRPSDFDVRMYLALAPYLQEVFSGTADAKLDVLGNSLRATISNEKYGRSVEAIRAKPHTASDVRIEAEADALSKKIDAGTATDGDLSGFMDHAAAWRDERGSEFLPPGASGAGHGSGAPYRLLDGLTPQPGAQ